MNKTGQRDAGKRGRDEPVWTMQMNSSNISLQHVARVKAAAGQISAVEVDNTPMLADYYLVCLFKTWAKLIPMSLSHSFAKSFIF